MENRRRIRQKIASRRRPLESSLPNYVFAAHFCRVVIISKSRWVYIKTRNWHYTPFAESAQQFRHEEINEAQCRVLKLCQCWDKSALIYFAAHFPQ
jgi:hypothetical protein